MDQYHESIRKKVSSGTGGRKRKYRDKKKCHIGGTFAATKVGEKDVKVARRVRGGNTHLRLKKSAYANVIVEGKAKKVKILGVAESHNPHYARQNIITKGAVLNTEAGKVRVTNRVGQDGMVNGVIVK